MSDGKLPEDTEKLLSELEIAVNNGDEVTVARIMKILIGDTEAATADAKRLMEEIRRNSPK